MWYPQYPLLRGTAPVDAAPSLEGCSNKEPRSSWIAEAGTQRVEQRTVIIVRFGGDSSKKEHHQPC